MGRGIGAGLETAVRASPVDPAEPHPPKSSKCICLNFTRDNFKIKNIHVYVRLNKETSQSSTVLYLMIFSLKKRKSRVVV